MEEKWKKYYYEIFKTYKSEFFIKLWGNNLDEYGDEYEEVYKYELASISNRFIEFMFLHQKYNIEYDENSIGMYIIEMFEGLGDCDHPEGAFEMAKLIIHSIKHRIGFNDIWHPEGRPI